MRSTVSISICTAMVHDISLCNSIRSRSINLNAGIKQQLAVNWWAGSVDGHGCYTTICMRPWPLEIMKLRWHPNWSWELVYYATEWSLGYLNSYAPGESIKITFIAGAGIFVGHFKIPWYGILSHCQGLENDSIPLKYYYWAPMPYQILIPSPHAYLSLFLSIPFV